LKFIALAAGRQPHFITITNFVSANCEAMGQLFHKVLLICDQSGLIGKEHFAIDGCKIPTNASKQWSGKKLKDEQKQTIETLLKNEKKIDKFLSEN
jgi:transposase